MSEDEEEDCPISRVLRPRLLTSSGPTYSNAHGRVYSETRPIFQAFFAPSHMKCAESGGGVDRSFVYLDF